MVIKKCLGDLSAYLEEIGEADYTIIIYASDHGLMLDEHGLGGKQFYMMSQSVFH